MSRLGSPELATSATDRRNGPAEAEPDADHPGEEPLLPPEDGREVHAAVRGYRGKISSAPKK